MRHARQRREGHARRRVGGGRRAAMRGFAIADDDEQERADIHQRRGEKGVTQPEPSREHAADHRAKRRPEPLRRLHHPIAAATCSGGADSAAMVIAIAP